MIIEKVRGGQEEAGGDGAEAGGEAGWDPKSLGALSGQGTEFEHESLLSDKMPRTVGFVYCFLRVPVVYLPCCLLPCCQGKLGELSEKSVRILYVRRILSVST